MSTEVNTRTEPKRPELDEDPPRRDDPPAGPWGPAAREEFAAATTTRAETPTDKKLLPPMTVEGLDTSAKPKGAAASPETKALGDLLTSADAGARGAKPYDPKAAAAHIKDLGDDNFDTRQKATDALSAMGPEVVGALAKEYASTRDLEVKNRIKSIVETIGVDKSMKHFDGTLPDKEMKDLMAKAGVKVEVTGKEIEGGTSGVVVTRDGAPKGPLSAADRKRFEDMIAKADELGKDPLYKHLKGKAAESGEKGTGGEARARTDEFVDRGREMYARALSGGDAKDKAKAAGLLAEQLRRTPASADDDGFMKLAETVGAGKHPEFVAAHQASMRRMANTAPADAPRPNPPAAAVPGAKGGADGKPAAGGDAKGAAGRDVGAKPAAGPREPYNKDTARELIAKLDSDVYAEREEASKRLAAMGPKVAGDLVDAYKAAPANALEVKKRIERLINGMDAKDLAAHFTDRFSERTMDALKEKAGIKKVDDAIDVVDDAPAGRLDAKTRAEFARMDALSDRLRSDKGYALARSRIGREEGGFDKFNALDSFLSSSRVLHATALAGSPDAADRAQATRLLTEHLRKAGPDTNMGDIRMLDAAAASGAYRDAAFKNAFVRAGGKMSDLTSAIYRHERNKK